MLQTAEAAGRLSRGPRRGTRAGVRGVGELLVTFGVVLSLFVVYQLFYTNLDANRAQVQVRGGLEKLWESDQDPALKQIPLGDGFALMRIPRLGRDWVKPVIHGIELDDLAKGLGHWPDSAMPGQVGNVAVAGHRATHGEPFAYLDKMRTGDAIVLETKDTWYVYRVYKSEIVLPSAVEVVAPVPGKPGAEPTRKLVTLVTCNPRWGSTHRLIVYGELESERPKSEGLPAALAA